MFNGWLAYSLPASLHTIAFMIKKQLSIHFHFKEIPSYLNMKDVASTTNHNHLLQTHSSQANSVCECLHKKIANTNTFQTLLHSWHPQNSKFNRSCLHCQQLICPFAHLPIACITLCIQLTIKFSLVPGALCHGFLVFITQLMSHWCLVPWFSSMIQSYQYHHHCWF